MDFRVSRHTDNLQEITQFYTQVLKFEIFGVFEKHNSYNGVFLGKKGMSWHLEFTQSNEKATHQFDEDDLLVFYPKVKKEYNLIIQNINKLQIPVLQSKNPYWNSNGIFIQDPDGYGIIISPLKIKNS